MKNSGVEWIGEIPEEWEVSKIGQLYEERRTKVSDTVYPPLSVTMQGILPQLETAAKSDAHDDRKLVLKGDFAINSRSDRRGSCGISEHDGSVSLINTVIHPKTEMNPIYYNWLFHSFRFSDEYYKNGHGIVDDLWTTSWSEMKRIFIPLPPKSIQQHIASYLDKKCSKIEETIQNQQQVIEKLKAYKQSLITEAVTGKIKIQNGKVCGKYESYKESGVEWIGKIPSEWEVGKFGRFAQVKSNLVDPNLYLEYPQIAPDNIGKGSGKLIDWQTVKDSGVISWNHLFFKGQIVYSKIRPTLNKLIIAPFDGLCSADMYPIETNIHKQFFVYMMLSQYFVEQVGLITRDRVKMPKINQNELSGILITVPTKEEQKEISDYLDKKCTAIDTVIEQKQKLIEKLTEYKKSLIYECVTGKKEI